jgi:hypothetical protein
MALGSCRDAAPSLAIADERELPTVPDARCSRSVSLAR